MIGALVAAVVLRRMVARPAAAASPDPPPTLASPGPDLDAELARRVDRELAGGAD